MEQGLVSKRDSLYIYTVTFFLYATLFVDLYRKMIRVNVETVRNVVYMGCLLLILWDAYKHKRLLHMLFVGGVMSLLYLLSSFIYSGHNLIYFSAWQLFVTRLWPGYYVGRYTEDWAGVSHCVRKFILFALLYAMIAFTSTVFDIAGANSTYATIASNLFFVVWIAFYDSFKSHKFIPIIICLVCFIPVMFLGTRAGMFGALLALVLYFGRVIKRSNAQKKALYYMLLIIGAVVITSTFGLLSRELMNILPNSRTLNVLLSGNIFDDSNRSDGFYSKMYASFEQNPLKMHGLIGNQIYLAGDNASADVIMSSFAHNVYLEICMNFGVIIGIFMGLYFTIVLIRAYLKSKWRKEDVEFVFLGVLGMTFVGMLVSYSWLFSYSIWLLFGMAYGVIHNKRIYKTNT